MSTFLKTKYYESVGNMSTWVQKGNDAKAGITNVLFIYDIYSICINEILIVVLIEKAKIKLNIKQEIYYGQNSKSS